MSLKDSSVKYFTCILLNKLLYHPSNSSTACTTGCRRSPTCFEILRSCPRQKAVLPAPPRTARSLVSLVIPDRDYRQRCRTLNATGIRFEICIHLVWLLGQVSLILLYYSQIDLNDIGF